MLWLAALWEVWLTIRPFQLNRPCGFECADLKSRSGQYYQSTQHILGRLPQASERHTGAVLGRRASARRFPAQRVRPRPHHMYLELDLSTTDKGIVVGYIHGNPGCWNKSLDHSRQTVTEAPWKSLTLAGYEEFCFTMEGGRLFAARYGIFRSFGQNSMKKYDKKNHYITTSDSKPLRRPQ